jgi:hypothetical protein
MKTEKTYKDNGKSKWHYANTIEVVCPKCSNMATLNTPSPNFKEPDLKCSNCYYSKKGFEYSTFKNAQKVDCKNCDSIFDI